MLYNECLVIVNNIVYLHWQHIKHRILTNISVKFFFVRAGSMCRKYRDTRYIGYRYIDILSYDVVISRSYCFTVWSAIVVIVSSGCPSVRLSVRLRLSVSVYNVVFLCIVRGSIISWSVYRAKICNNVFLILVGNLVLFCFFGHFCCSVCR